MPERTNWHTDARNGQRTRADLYWWTDGMRRDQKKLDQLITDFQVVSNDDQRGEAYRTYASLYTNRRIDPSAALLSTYESDWYIKK